MHYVQKLKLPHLSNIYKHKQFELQSHFRLRMGSQTDEEKHRFDKFYCISKTKLWENQNSFYSIHYNNQNQV